MRRFAITVQVVSLLVIVAALVVITRAMPLKEALEWLERSVENAGLMGPAIFAAAYAVAVTLFLPASPFTLAAGAVFGIWIGSLTTLAGALGGTALTFVISRYLAREKVEELIKHSSRMRAMDQAIAERGWQVVALLRCTPFLPLSAQNYLYGVSPIRFWTCILTSVVFMLPGIVLYNYFGVVARRGAEVGLTEMQSEPHHWVIAGIVVVAAIISGVVLKRIGTRYLAIVGVEEEAADDSGDFERSARRWRAAILAVCAVAMVALAGWVHTHPQQVRDFFSAAAGAGANVVEGLRP